MQALFGHRRWWLPVLVVAGLAVAGGVAYATIPDSSGVIHGCFKTQNGQLRVVSGGESCLSGEQAIQWNQGGPTGLQGPPGDKGPTGDKGAVGDKGPVGDKGATGDKGLPGDKGLSGDKGATGDKGLPGDKGLVGDKGATGDKGLPGDKGPTGDPGAPGGRRSVQTSTVVPLQPEGQPPTYTEIAPWSPDYYGTLRVSCQAVGTGESDIVLKVVNLASGGPLGSTRLYVSAFLPPDVTSPNNLRAFDHLLPGDGGGIGGIPVFGNDGLINTEVASYDYRVRRLVISPDGSLVLSAVQVLVGMQRLADGSCSVTTMTFLDQ